MKITSSWRRLGSKHWRRGSVVQAEHWAATVTSGSAASGALLRLTWPPFLV